MQATLCWRVLEAYRRTVGSSRLLTAVHAVLAWPARKLIVRRPAPAQDPELVRLQSTLGWWVLVKYRGLIHSSALLFGARAIVAHFLRTHVARAPSRARVSGAPVASSSSVLESAEPPTRTVITGNESPWSSDRWQRPGTKNKARRYLKYPLYLPSPVLTRRERLMVKVHFGVVKCTVCGRFAPLVVEHDNLRETALCCGCGARTRQRQIAYVVCQALSLARNRRLRSMREAAQLDSLVVYNTETTGPLHNVLSRRPDYLSSEYLGPGLMSGTILNGVMHQDLMKLSFPSESIDLVLSSDVIEHVADPYRAHAELFRVLRPGGRHVFTVPFYQTEFLDEVRATVDDGGAVVHLKEPVYHEDPVRQEEGALVYTVFAVEMLAKLRRIGFRTNMYLLHSHWHGMLGPNGLVFEAIK